MKNLAFVITVSKGVITGSLASATAAERRAGYVAIHARGDQGAWPDEFRRATA